MNITGEMLIGARFVRGSEGTLHAVNPATGEQLEPSFGGGSAADVDAACKLAEAAFDSFRALSLEKRAAFLEAIAQGILDLGEILVERVIAESGLPRGRVEGERGRTVFQLRLFASLAREGRWLNATLDRAMPDRSLRRADLDRKRFPSVLLPYTAPAIFLWPSPSPVAIPPLRLPPAARSSLSRTPRI